MSFKREGDDRSQLNLLKKRRVSDLLADDIPEDEAFLMSNGRYACTVCNHRPVLDTIAMLLVHRQGKKHQSYVKSYYAKKQNFMKEVEKRKQQLYLMKEERAKSSLEEIEDVAPLLTKTRKATHHALLKAAPYKGYGRPSSKQEGSSQSFQAKTGGSFFQRVSQNSLEQESIHRPPTFTTSIESLPGNRVQSSTSQSETATDGPSTHNTKAQNNTGDAIGRSKDALGGDSLSKLSDQNDPLTVTEKRCPTSFQLKPYIPKHQRNKCQARNACVDSTSVTITTTQSDSQTKGNSSLTAEQESTLVTAPPSLESYASGKESTRGLGNVKCGPGTCAEQISPILRKDVRSSRKISESTSKFSSLTAEQKSTLVTTPSSLESHASGKETTKGFGCNKYGLAGTCKEQTNLNQKKEFRSSRKTSESTSKSTKSSIISEDTRRTDREKYLKMTSSGWKTDWKGGWVQDQDVEFDSDEEVPD